MTAPITTLLRRSAFPALLLPAALLIGCSSQAADPAPAPAAQESAATHPESGLEIIPLEVETTGGETLEFRVEVARTPEQQARGLMFRTEMGENEGMLFPYGRPRMLGFWMKNTVIPLDIIFIGPDRRVVNVAADAVPYSEETLRSTAPAIAVLELNGGRAEELGIEPGAEVSW